MKLMKNAVVAMTVIVILYSCEKVSEATRSPAASKKNIPNFLALMANDYCKQINAYVDHIDDTLTIHLWGPPALIDNVDTFKLKYVDSVALRIGKNVYWGFTGDYSVGYVKRPNGLPVSTAELGNLYFYIYSDFYQLEPDSTYTIVNLRFLYNTTEPPFK